jgi:hypothetical protein
MKFYKYALCAAAFAAACSPALVGVFFFQHRHTCMRAVAHFRVRLRTLLQSSPTHVASVHNRNTISKRSATHAYESGGKPDRLLICRIALHRAPSLSSPAPAAFLACMRARYVSACALVSSKQALDGPGKPKSLKTQVLNPKHSTLNTQP